MSFQSLSFAVFFLLTLAACLWAGRRSRRVGEWALVAASAVFYLWDFSAHALAGLAFLCAGTAVSRLAARYLRSADAVRRKGVLFVAIAYHAAVLLSFKYTGFFSGGALRIGWAPLGLSFFTFQQIWFLKRVYTGEFSWPEGGLPVGRSLLFSLFFPTVSSGPILRPDDFFPQLEGGRFLHPDWSDAAAGIYGVSMGLAKKVLLADALGAIADNGYAHPLALTAPEAWLVILAYTLQLYLDFSGYCDIAAGLARLLGLRLPRNFDSPYRALSVGEFWKRWHMTLTNFLRECVYIPLGGSRKGRLRTWCNILLVFLLSGFWHGAGWTFLLWGALHGLAQIAERLWGPGRDRLPVWLRWAATFAFINVCWVFFRAPDTAAALALLRSAVLGGFTWSGNWIFSGVLRSEAKALVALVPALANRGSETLGLALYPVGLYAALTKNNTVRCMERPLSAPRGVLACLALVWSMLSFTGIATFLYSNF